MEPASASPPPGKVTRWSAMLTPFPVSRTSAVTEQANASSKSRCTRSRRTCDPTFRSRREFAPEAPLSNDKRVGECWGSGCGAARHEPCPAVLMRAPAGHLRCLLAIRLRLRQYRHGFPGVGQVCAALEADLVGLALIGEGAAQLAVAAAEQ